MLTSEMATFAARQNLTPAQATVLPALFEHVAKSFKLSARGLLAEATYRNADLGRYLAQVAQTVAEREAL